MSLDDFHHLHFFCRAYFWNYLAKSIMAFLSWSKQSGLHPKWGSIGIKLVPFVRLQSWLPIKPNHLSTLLVLIVCAKPRLPSTVWREIKRGWVRQVRNSLKADEIERKRSHDTSQRLFRCSIRNDNQNNRDFTSGLFRWGMECLV